MSSSTSPGVLVTNMSERFQEDTTEHEREVLKNLATRYANDDIYTYAGNILVVLNPFQKLNHLYDDHMMNKYKGAALSESNPHIFAMCTAVYRAMINDDKSHSIIVSGESGAGKTEITKNLMSYLAFLGMESGAEKTIHRVLQCIVVLEAFGNAKTERNNNSSRCGKFVDIQFHNSGRVSGATIKTYLLERSRVCEISDSERNYHCFYYLCAAPVEHIEKYKLGKPQTFHYLNQSKCYQLDGVDDACAYRATREAMDVVGINYEEQESIFRLLAAILHLGNINFAKEKETDSTVIAEKSRFHLIVSAELLKCDANNLEDALIKRMMSTPEETITKTLDPEHAVGSRDALAKTIYCHLFDWLVDKINNSIGQETTSKSSIGVLDIYGFENLKSNSFEQFCINFTNEKLHQHFNQNVFKLEQEEYFKEEIDWSHIGFVDNQDVLDLIEKKRDGIIALLDEACKFPKSTNETLAEKLYQTFQNHRRFIKPKCSHTDFIVAHYAGEVTYQVNQFLDKNKDHVVAAHHELLTASNCPFVAGIFTPLPQESSKFSTIGSRYKLQLQSLMETLSATEPHYILCVKPNNDSKPTVFENSNVLQQLRCGGVLEAIRIHRAGYPIRRTFNEFRHRYGLFASEVLEGNFEDKVACRMILDKNGLRGCQIGKTKVFLKLDQMTKLEGMRADLIRFAATLQSCIRGYRARKLYEKKRGKAIAPEVQNLGPRSRSPPTITREIGSSSRSVPAEKQLDLPRSSIENSGSRSPRTPSIKQLFASSTRLGLPQVQSREPHSFLTLYRPPRDFGSSSQSVGSSVSRFKFGLAPPNFTNPGPALATPSNRSPNLAQRQVNAAQNIDDKQTPANRLPNLAQRQVNAQVQPPPGTETLPPPRRDSILTLIGVIGCHMSVMATVIGSLLPFLKGRAREGFQIFQWGLGVIAFVSIVVSIVCWKTRG